MKKIIAIFVLAALLVPSVMTINAMTANDGKNVGSIMLNNPPAKPTISGPASGETGKSYTYTAVTTDPDGDKVFYCFDWGDGDEICTDLYNSGQEVTVSHTWNSDGDYTITVKATDENGAESEPATLKVTMPLVKPKSMNTHTVLAEMGSTTWCPSCPPADEQIEALYSSGNYPFYYVTLVYDTNKVAQTRGGWLRDSYIPMLYLDGGYKVADNPTMYGQDILSVSQREVNPLSMNISAEWKGDAKIDITVSITNEGTKSYFGHLRVYVTEVVSRWNNQKGEPFRYALLDYAFNKYVSIPAGGTYEETTTWDGTADHNGNTYGDITPDNIMVIGGIAHWMPHLEKNPWTQPKPYRFIAQYTDQAAAAIVES